MRIARRQSCISFFTALGCAILLAVFFVILLPALAYAEETADAIGNLAAGTVADDEPEPAPVETVPLYRMYNVYSGEHFYTSSESEKSKLVKAGWFYEGIGWQAPATSNTPVYRLYNPKAGDHHYTVSAKERDGLKKKGWKDEGVGWYSDDAETIPVYRQYNPRSRTGTHNFTCSENEDKSLVKAGWRAEGTSWYACAEGQSDSLTWFSSAHLYALVTCIGGGWKVTAGYNTTIDSAKVNRLKSLVATDVPVGFVAINTRTGKSVAYNADYRVFSASTIKAPFLAALCKYKAPNLRSWISEMENIIRWSDNEDYHAIASEYGTSYETRLANESHVSIDYPYSYGYTDITPRELVKLWITMRAFIISSDTNSDLFRSLFNRGYIKEGWMYSDSWCGQMYHVAGIKGDVVYAVMTLYIYQDSRALAIRDAAVAAVS